MVTNIELHAYADLLPMRLDLLLKQHLALFSRTFLARHIEQGFVWVDGQVVVKSSFLIKPNVKLVSIAIQEPSVQDLVPHPLDLEIIDQNQDFLIINKPAGLLVHPAPTQPNAITLVHGLLHYFKLADFDAKANAAQRPGIVHRLDQDTSGLIIVARHQLAMQELSEMFAQRLVTKKYWAVCKGVAPEKYLIDRPIGRNVIHPHKMSIGGIGAREAQTIIRRLQHNAEYSLVEAHILTGRTHQIRVHLAHLGHSIVSDALYGQSSPLMARQALHAYSLEFAYKGQQYSYRCLPDPDLQHFIKVTFGLDKL